jgi:hypothetical protein
LIGTLVLDQSRQNWGTRRSQARETPLCLTVARLLVDWLAAALRSLTRCMEPLPNSLRTFIERAKASAREIALALVLTLCAAGFIVAAMVPSAGEPKTVLPTPR